MKATVIGCGRWGSFIAWYLRKIGHEVTLYGQGGLQGISSSFVRRAPTVW